MKRIALFLILLAGTALAAATPWVYRGALTDSGRPATGVYDLRLTLIDGAGVRAITPSITLFNVQVRDGSFAAEVDFGIDLGQAGPMQLRTEVAHDGSAFVALGAPTRFDPKAALAGVCWDTQGNAGINPGTDFIGTTDAQPLILKANGARVSRFDMFPLAIGDTSNVTAGSSANGVTVGVRGATIAGGGTALGESDPDASSDGPNIVGDAYGTVGGGYANQAGDANGTAVDQLGATVSGGYGNLASTSGSTISGGRYNRAAGFMSVITGGQRNTASGLLSGVGGGDLNCAGGNLSWTGGFRARARTGNEVTDVQCIDGVGTVLPNSGDASGDEGSFVWADSTNADFVTTGANQFIVRAGGGVMLNTNALPSNGDDLVIATHASGDADSDLAWLSRNGKLGRIFLSDSNGTFQWNSTGLTGTSFLAFSNGARLTAGGVFTNASSRELKAGFASIDPLAMLDRVMRLPITTWHYKASSEGEHIGPVAEDFKAIFELGGDGKSIPTVDADGVALAAIQGLNQKLEAENANMRARLDAIEAQLNR